MNLPNLRRVAAYIFLAFTLAACGGGGGGGGAGGGGSGGGANSPPRITSPTSFEFDENALVSFVIEVADADGDTITIRDDLNGDGRLFIIDPSTGVVTANTPTQSFDFENPLDANRDNIYEQNITLSDGKTTVNATIRVTIRDVDEPPVFNYVGVIEVLENTAGPIVRFTAEDPEGQPVELYHISSVSKLGEVFNSEPLRRAFSMDPDTGVLSVEIPFDAEVDGVRDHITVTVGASDGTNIGYGGVHIQLVDVPSRVVDGVAINGEDLPGSFGDYTQSLGDIDGDGIDDFWISQGMPTSSPSPTELSGWVVWGRTISQKTGRALDLTQSDLTADRAIGFRKYASNASATDPIRLVAQSAGDIDGDGVRDILIGIHALDYRYSADDRENAAIVFGSALRNHFGADYDLNHPPPNAQIDIVGLTAREAMSLVHTSGDFDGDGRSDVVIASGESRVAWVIFAPAISRARAAGRLDLSQSSLDDVVRLEMRRRDTYGEAILQWAAFVESLPDVTADGRDELIVQVMQLASDEGFSNDEIAIVSGEALVAARDAGVARLNLADLVSTNDMVVFHAPNTSISAIATNGDIDADGLADVAVVHPRISMSDKLGSIIFGKSIRAAFLAGQNPSMDFVDPAIGVSISLVRDQDTDAEIPVIADGAQLVGLIGSLEDVTFIPSFVDGPGDEVAFGRAQYFALGRLDAGAIFVFRDGAIANAQQAQITISDEASLLPVGRKLQGTARYSALGGSIFAADLDGDGISDLSMSSASAGPRVARFAPYGAYYMVPGYILRTVFDNAVASFDLSNAIADETPPTQ